MEKKFLKDYSQTTEDDTDFRKFIGKALHYLPAIRWVMIQADYPNLPVRDTVLHIMWQASGDVAQSLLSLLDREEFEHVKTYVHYAFCVDVFPQRKDGRNSLVAAAVYLPPWDNGVTRTIRHACGHDDVENDKLYQWEMEWSHDEGLQVEVTMDGVLAYLAKSDMVEHG